MKSYSVAGDWTHVFPDIITLYKLVENLNDQKQFRQICNKMAEIKRKESVVGSGQWAPASYEYKLDTTAYTKERILSQIS